MFTHDDIWSAIDRLAESKGLSASGLARLAGLDPTAFNRSKRISPNGKPRWPSTESLSRILAVTECTMSELLSLMDQSESDAAKSIPLLSYAHMQSGRIAPEKQPQFFRPCLDVNEDCFAVPIGDNSLSPLFRNGATLIIDPSAKIKAGDRVLLFSKQDGIKGGIVHAGPKKSWSIQLPETGFEAQSFGENDIEWIMRVMWSSH
jgi:phage repressor protein C with HTH and peptisase S24 domain